MLISELLVHKPENKICVFHGDKSITYGKLEELTDTLASGLAAKGLAKGEKVLVCNKSLLQQLIYFMAVVKAGGVCVMFPDSASLDERTLFRKKHGIKLQIDERFICPLANKKRSLLEKEDIFLGALSSGTTGEAKLILRDHQSWIAAFPKQGKIFNVKNSDVLYIAGSLSYTANLNACVHALYEGATMVFAKSRMPKTWLTEMKEHAVTAVFMVPANYRMLLSRMREPYEKMSSLVSGGAKMDNSIVKGLIEKFPNAHIVEYYGASELGHITYAEKSDLLKRPESVGRAFPGVTIRVRKGKIFVKSPYIVPALSPEATVDDMGHMDKDGYLTLLGRESGIINVAGNKVVLQQVENAIKSSEKIVDAAVIGVPDGLRGEKIHAFVVAKDMDTQEFMRFCHARLEQHSCPHKVMFIKKMPLNDNGKINLKLLKEMVGESI